MYDAFGSSGGSRSQRALKKKDPSASFSPSYGVRHGFMADEERPVPAGSTNRRGSRRVPMTFEVLLEGDWRRLAGDLSVGGALFLSPVQAQEDRIQLRVRLSGVEREWNAVGFICGVERRGVRFAHHVQFLEADDPTVLAQALERTATES
jgi:hypothetical protein